MAQNDRLHALDAVRAFALLLGIVLHATMSFFLPVPALDSSQSATLAVVFYVIHVFRMSLFYLIAGFFARMLLERRGTRGFVKDRSKRILGPLVGGWIVLAPLTIGAVVWGLSRQDTSLEELGAAAGAQAPGEGFPLIHLWFLYYLCIFYVIALALRAWLPARADRKGRLRTGLDAALRAVLSMHVAPFVIAAPLLGTLFVMETPPWGGIPTPDVGIVPQIPALIGFGTAFGVGWLLHRQLDVLMALRSSWAVNLALAGVLTGSSLWLVGLPNAAEAADFDGAWQRVAYLACYTAAIWYWSFGLIGAALELCSGHSAVRRYLADSSYWLYLAHLPVVFFLQVAVADLPWHWTIKFPLILGVAMAVLLASYHYLVRPTLLGELLNGRRYVHGKRPPEPEPSGPPGHPGPPDSPVASLDSVTKRYGETLALTNVDLTVERGELLAVLGPNGAGKSTAISLWLGLLEPDEGTVSLMGGSPLETISRLEVGVMMQEVSLAAELRARELVELTASYYPSPLSARETMALTHTSALAERRYGELSAGQKRQIQFTAAVCGRPKLLFLDEPTVGLDVQARETMWRTIRALIARGCSIVLTTHYLEEAEALADRVAVLARGRLIALGSVAEMRSLVSRKQIRCTCTADADEIKLWPGVLEAVRDAGTVQITAVDAENVVRRLLAADEHVCNLEVRQATLAEAFTELTREAA